MNTTVNVPEKAKNYTDEQEAHLVSNAPISFEDTQVLAVAWDKSPASVRAKVISMGLEYVPKARPSKKVSKGDTKAELVSKIEEALDAWDMLKGLEKSTASALVNLLGCAKIAMQDAKNASS